MPIRTKNAYLIYLFLFMKQVYDVCHMPSFLDSFRSLQQENKINDSSSQNQNMQVETIEIYDEMLDKFCYGSKKTAEIKNILSKI